MKVATSATVAILLAPSVLGQPVAHEGSEAQQDGIPSHQYRSAEGKGGYGGEYGGEGMPPPPHGGHGAQDGGPPPYHSKEASLINTESLPPQFQKYGEYANHGSRMYGQVKSGQVPPEVMEKFSGQSKQAMREPREKRSLYRRDAYPDPEADAEAGARTAIYDSWLGEADQLHARSLDDQLVARSPQGVFGGLLRGGKAVGGFLEKKVLTPQNEQRMREGLHSGYQKVFHKAKPMGPSAGAGAVHGAAPGAIHAPRLNKIGSVHVHPPKGVVPPPPPPRPPLQKSASWAGQWRSQSMGGHPHPEPVKAAAPVAAPVRPPGHDPFAEPGLQKSPTIQKSPTLQKSESMKEGKEKEAAQAKLEQEAAAGNGTAKKPSIFNSNNIMAATMVGSMIPAFMPQGDKSKDQGKDGQGQNGQKPPPGGGPAPGTPGAPGGPGGPPKPPVKTGGPPPVPAAPSPPIMGKRDLSHLDFYDHLVARSAMPEEDALYARDADAEADADALDYLDEAALWARDAEAEAEAEPEFFDEDDHELMARWAAADANADAYPGANDDGFEADELSRRDLYARDAYAEPDPEAWAEPEAFDDDYYGEY